MELEYDPEHDLNYGMYRCKVCKSKFFGGGRAMHERSCTSQNYRDCVLIFGPKHIDEVKRVAAAVNDDEKWWGISLNDLKTHFPQLL